MRGGVERKANVHVPSESRREKLWPLMSES